MGVDLTPVNQINPDGEYFQTSWWYWRPIVWYIEDIAPAIYKKLKPDHWMHNDGFGLDEKTSVTLSGVIDNHINSGGFEKYTAEYEKWNSRADQASTKALEPYELDLEQLKEFSAFLRNCGGFQIH